MKNKTENMKKPTNAPITTLCTATRRQTTYHRDPSGACTAVTTSQSTADAAVHTTELPANEAATLTLRLALQALDLLS